MGRLRLAGASWMPRHVAVAILCVYISFAVSVEGDAVWEDPSTGGGTVVDEPPVHSNAPAADGDSSHIPTQLRQRQSPRIMIL